MTFVGPLTLSLPGGGGAASLEAHLGTGARGGEGSSSYRNLQKLQGRTSNLFGFFVGPSGKVLNFPGWLEHRVPRIADKGPY